MGYPQIGKNRVLVLPVPASNMTAEEYKEAFGIDLSDIELRDLILLQEEGKEAFPVLYIDKENKILYTADRAFSYDGEFAAVVGDSLVAKVIETGMIENAKPIYCHPISITDNNLYCPRLTCLIFNNDSTPFTLETFKQFIDNLAVATNNKGRLMMSGGVKVSTYAIIISYMQKGGDNNYYLVGNKASDGSPDVLTSADFDGLFPTATTSLEDGVNKIN